MSIATFGLMFFTQSRCDGNFLSAHSMLACAREDLSVASIIQVDQPSLTIAVGFGFVLFAISMYFVLAYLNKTSLITIYSKTERYLHLPRHGPHKMQGIKFILSPRSDLVAFQF